MIHLAEEYRLGLDEPIVQALEEAAEALNQYIEIVQESTPIASSDVPQTDTTAWLETLRGGFDWVCDVTKFNWGYPEEDDEVYEDFDEDE